MDHLDFKVNDRKYHIPSFSGQLDKNLLSFIRDEGLTGSKQVCGEGGCGACTVILSQWDDDRKEIVHKSVAACLVPLPTLQHCQVTTIEGLSLLTKNPIHPVCDAFYQLGASQCGFCTPGFIMAFVARLFNSPEPSRKDLERIFDGNLCRCTGYRPIMDAASVFCKDPLLNDEYLVDIQLWREEFENSAHLSSLFPKEFKHRPESKIFQGVKTSWAQPTKTSEVEKLMQNDFAQPLDNKIPGETKMISGNTDVGYWESQHPEHYKKRIYLNRVERLGQFQWTEQGLEIGAGITISELCQELESHKESGKKLTHSLEALLSQCRYFANNQVRNMATVGGGLMNFSTYSDLIPVWVATKAEAIFIKDGKEEKLLLQKKYDGHKLNFDPNEPDLLLAIFVPFSKENEIIANYKYARRRMDSISFLSACLYGQVNPKKSLSQAILCFDGLGIAGFRALKTEKLLENQVWSKELNKKALSTIEEEVLQHNKSPYNSRLKKHQARLAVGAFLRFYEQFCTENLPAKFSGDHQLSQRYPQVAHRSHIQFEENAVGVLGKSIPHLNAKNQVMGLAKYTFDQEAKNCLFAALVTSPVASGEIKSIDPSQALKQEGVVAFYSADDIPGKNEFGFRLDDDEVLAAKKVHYVGQPIGVLVAQTESMAKEYAKLVKLDIKESKALLEFEDAIKAYSLHGKKEGYLLKQGENDFDNCHKVIEGELNVTGQSHFYLEPQSAMVIPKEDGYHVYSSTQSPSNVVDHISKVLNISNNKVEVEVGRIGGGFGGKQLRAGPIAAICAVASHHQNQPVKLALQRHEDMAFCPGRSPLLAKYKAGFSKDGKIKALDVLFYLNGGYSSDYSADITETATLLMDNCYKLSNVKIHGFCLKMNHGSYTSTRGFGKPQASTVIENIIDHGARSLGLDPTEVRSKNLYQKGDKTITQMELKDDVISKCWNHLLKKSDYQQLRQDVDSFNRKNKWLKRGLAVVSSKGNMGFLETDDINRGLAILQVLRDGTITLNHSGCEMGQGINTRMAQVAAYNLDRPLDSVEVTDTQSNLIPNTPPTTMVASDLIGKATIQACNEIKNQLKDYGGSFLEKVAQAYDNGKPLSATGIYTAPRLYYDYKKQQGDISYFFVWGAALSLVEIDVISGSFRIIKSNVVQDCGKSLNPHLDVGQAEGGFMFGVGYSTMEEPIYSQKGKLITDNVSGYKVPSCGDVPLDWDIELFNYAPTDEGLHNSKGIGEANTQLGLSVYFSIKDAVKAAREEVGLSSVFPMGFPASVDRVSDCLPDIKDLL